MLGVVLLIACLVNFALAAADRNWSAIAGWFVALLGAINSMVHGY